MASSGFVTGTIDPFTICVVDGFQFTMQGDIPEASGILQFTVNDILIYEFSFSGAAPIAQYLFDWRLTLIAGDVWTVSLSTDSMTGEMLAAYSISGWTTGYVF